MAAHWFEVAVAQGSPHAMFMLANAYRSGVGVARSDEKAIALYEKAGELGFAPALQALAIAYRYGELGLGADETESRRYSTEAENLLEHEPQAPP